MNLHVTLPHPHNSALRTKTFMSVTESAVDDRRHTSAWLLLIGVAFTVGASTTYMVLRAAFGDRPAHINVRWSPATTPDVQQRREQQYHLTYGQRTEGRTFSYDLTDLSRNNIRAMVLDPSVEDTHYIHRTAYRIWRFAPRSKYHDGGEKWGPLLEATVVALGLIAAIAFVLAVGERVLPPRLAARIPLRKQFIHPRDAVASLLQSIVGCIPAGSAEQVAVLRIVLGVALLALFRQQRVGPAFVLQSTNVLTSLHQWLLAPFVRAPNLTQWILPWLLVWSVLFIAGAASRFSYLMLTFGAFAWATVLTTRLGYHMVSALLVALLCLIPSRWGDTWSVDAWWRRRQLRLPARTGTPQEYGYTIWMPGVVVGVIFAAAAVAKLHESGIAWILNGTVKYHFLSDAASAPLDWGLRVGLYPKLAVALSFAAILIEAAIVFGSFARHYVFRDPADLLRRIGASQKNDGPISNDVRFSLTFHQTRWCAVEGARIYRHDPRAMQAYRRDAREALDQWQEWDRLRVPVLLIHGLQSDALTQPTIDRMVRTNSVRVMHVPDTGHTPVLADRNQIWFIQQWLRENREVSGELTILHAPSRETFPGSPVPFAPARSLA